MAKPENILGKNFDIQSFANRMLGEGFEHRDLTSEHEALRMRKSGKSIIIYWNKHQGYTGSNKLTLEMIEKTKKPQQSSTRDKYDVLLDRVLRLEQQVSELMMEAGFQDD